MVNKNIVAYNFRPAQFNVAKKSVTNPFLRKTCGRRTNTQLQKHHPAHHDHDPGEQSTHHSKPTEFGKMVKMQEAENQIITSYEVYEKRPLVAAARI